MNKGKNVCGFRFHQEQVQECQAVLFLAIAISNYEFEFAVARFSVVREQGLWFSFTPCANKN